MYHCWYIRLFVWNIVKHRVCPSESENEHLLQSYRRHDTINVILAKSLPTPPSQTLHKITGRWTLNKDHSDSFAPVLRLHGVNGFIRGTTSHTSVYFETTQPRPYEIHLRHEGSRQMYQKRRRQKAVEKIAMTVLLMQAEGIKPDNEWCRIHIVGLNRSMGERRQTKRIYMVDNKTKEDFTIRMVYDFDGE